MMEIENKRQSHTWAIKVTSFTYESAGSRSLNKRQLSIERGYNMWVTRIGASAVWQFIRIQLRDASAGD